MGILSDFSLIDKIGDDELATFAEQLNSNPLTNPIDDELFAKWYKDKAIETRDIQSIIAFLRFSSNVVSGKREIIQGINEIKKIIFGERPIPDEYKSAWIKLENLLPLLGEFILNNKEKRLINQANRILQFSLTCDLRPLFDLERTSVKKYLFPVLLTLRDSHESKVFNYELTEDDLVELQDEIKYALIKLKLLKSTFTT